MSAYLGVLNPWGRKQGLRHANWPAHTTGTAQEEGRKRRESRKEEALLHVAPSSGSSRALPFSQALPTVSHTVYSLPAHGSYRTRQQILDCNCRRGDLPLFSLGAGCTTSLAMLLSLAPQKQQLHLHYNTNWHRTRAPNEVWLTAIQK